MEYVRCTMNNTAFYPGVGFAMFVDAKKQHRIENAYGEYRWSYDGKNGIDINDLKQRFIDAWENYKEAAPEYMQSLSSEEFFETFNPIDIVEDAGAWDNDDFRRFFQIFIYNCEDALLLNDGAIVFEDAANLVQYKPLD